jgi:hypothetical protein
MRPGEVDLGRAFVSSDSAANFSSSDPPVELIPRSQVISEHVESRLLFQEHQPSAAMSVSAINR